MPGVPLRFLLATVYSVLSVGLDDFDRYALDTRLGLVGESEPMEVDEHGQAVVVLDDDPRLAADVPTSVHDPAAMAALAQFGEQDLA